ncbi:hypothetical protein [Haloechinothrix aidingensis]|nr:hypothetical protein [Haloechinothrix aidingensis]
MTANTLHTTFSETMAGQCRISDTGSRTSCRLDLDVTVAELLHPMADTVADLRGRVTVPGLAEGSAAHGTLHIAPLTRKRLRYQLDFTALDGRALHLDGWKSVSFKRPLRSMTTLPATITDESGQVVAETVVRFSIPRHLWPMLRSFRLRRNRQSHVDDLLPRWDGTPGRLEVWYTTLTDPDTGTGVWVHHELVAPSDSGPARLHGWAAVFPPDGPPVLDRFGPRDWHPPRHGWIADTSDVTISPTHLRGTAGQIEWDLHAEPSGPTLFTFPQWAWRTGVLPGAQVVPRPAERFRGAIRYQGHNLHLADAPGATAHIYGHGNARRWAWLHADLGDGDVAEVVAAVSTRPGLRRLPPLPFVRLRIGGRELPAGDTLLAALRLKADVGLPTWRVWGRSGEYWLHIEVTQPPEDTVDVDYRNPDGSPAVCHNTERAHAHLVVQRRTGGRWTTYREWTLDGTAHAEVGSGVTDGSGHERGSH